MNSDEPRPPTPPARELAKQTSQPTRSRSVGGDADDEADFQPPQKPQGKPDEHRARFSGAPPDSKASPAAEQKKGKGLGLKLGIAALMVGGGLFVFQSFSPGSTDEKSSQSWSLVEKAKDQVRRGPMEPLAWRDKQGAVQISSGIKLTPKDLSPAVTQRIQQEAKANDLKAANDQLQNAQQLAPMPSKARNADGSRIKAVQPALTPAMLQSVAGGETKFIQVYVWDSCVQDGDVVDVLIDDVPFLTIPMTVKGSSVALPVARSGTKIALRGVYDGGGGITVGLATSEGDFYTRPMMVGETALVGAVRF